MAIPGNSLRAWTPPGKRNRIIMIQSEVATGETDAHGGEVKAWTDFTPGGVWAYVRPLRSRELIAAQAAQSLTEVIFNISYVAGITADMRIVYNGKNYDITDPIDVDEARRELDIMAKTGLSEG